MRVTIFLIIQLIAASLIAQSNTEMHRFKAPDARQAVAANATYFFTINNNRIVKQNKLTGEIENEWEDTRLKHLNSGVIIGDKLYCAHSNYPQIPMHSSIEVFSTKTLAHIQSHSFGINHGSCTWIDQRDGYWYIMFVHYDGDKNRQTNRDVSWSQLIKYNSDWQQVEAWVLPPTLVERVSPYSISGGVFSSNGKLVCTHHHFKELYILSFPQMGSELVWETTIESPIRGQGIAFDTHEPEVLWGIDKSTREVIKTKYIHQQLQ